MLLFFLCKLILEKLYYLLLNVGHSKFFLGFEFLACFCYLLVLLLLLEGASFVAYWCCYYCCWRELVLLLVGAVGVAVGSEKNV
jgi:hypothetical protein